MKIIGTYEEICAINCFLLNNHPICCQYQQPWIDLDGSHYSGKWKGFDIDFEIIKKPMTIGIITDNLTKDEIRFYVNRILANHSGGLYIHASSTKYYVKCYDDSTIESFENYCIRGHKFDELWMESLPSNWDEFDLCISSVMGKRKNIHFFKELKTNKEAE